MPDESAASGSSAATWTRAAALDRIQPSRPIAVRLEGKQIALFVHRGEVFACNNRCPHEGYPLVEGVVDCDFHEVATDESGARARCVLTCNWHNWKFDLRTGATLYGGDKLRVYPVMVRDGAVFVDLADAPGDARVDEALAHLDTAIIEFDTARIARELARLEKAGAPPRVALQRVIIATHDRLRDGMTHAYAAADAWFSLRDRLDDDAATSAGVEAIDDRAHLRLACAAEALGYIAFDTLRERAWPYTERKLPWNAHAFAAAIESQDEECAVALVAGALESGRRFADLENALVTAALAHYNDFGHSLIYLDHAARLIRRLDRDVELPLLKAWIRSLVYATREDLLPDFREYGAALDAWMSRSSPHAGSHTGISASQIADALEGLPVRRALGVVVDHASVPVSTLHAALLETASRHLLRFDESHALRTDNSIADNVGWLDFSHALTFGHALRRMCTRHPALWPQGLLQLALFCGRTNTYLDPKISGPEARLEWTVDDEQAFHKRAVERIVDHGLGLPIFPAHWLKTWSAVREAIEDGVPQSTRAAMLAAVNRLLAVRFKQRHPLRTARQALRFVRLED